MSSKVSDKKRRENQTETMGEWSGRHNVEWNVVSVKTRKKCCREVKRLLLGVIDVKPAGLIVTFRKGLRSSSSLRVVAIQAIDIFIRGCYL